MELSLTHLVFAPARGPIKSFVFRSVLLTLKAVSVRATSKYIVCITLPFARYKERADFDLASLSQDSGLSPRSWRENTSENMSVGNL